MKLKSLRAEFEVAHGDGFVDFASKLIVLAKETGTSVKAEWPSYGVHIEIVATPNSTLEDLKKQKDSSVKS